MNRERRANPNPIHPSVARDVCETLVDFLGLIVLVAIVASAAATVAKILGLIA